QLHTACQKPLAVIFQRKFPVAASGIDGNLRNRKPYFFGRFLVLCRFRFQLLPVGCFLFLLCVLCRLCSQTFTCLRRQVSPESAAAGQPCCHTQQVHLQQHFLFYKKSS